MAVLPMVWFGVPGGNDQVQHYQFAWTVFESVKSGDIYPSFAAWTNHGFGDYGLRFYPPLTYYLLAGLRALTGDWYVATLMAWFAVFFVGALGVFVWTRDLVDTRTALIAAALYTFLPYHLNEIYNNALLAEFVATAVLPSCFLYLDRTMREPGLKNALLLATSCSLLVLTHLPLTLIGGVAMGIYALCLVRREKFLGQVRALLGAAFMTAVTTAFYWSRWIGELAWITHNSERYFSTTWDYRTNFLLVPSHWTSLGEDVLNLWFADLMLIVAVLVVLPAIVIFARQRGGCARLMPAFVVTVVAVLMATIMSKPLWDIVTPLQKVQFPWRWLAVVSIFAAVLGAVGITRIFDAGKQSTSRLTAALVAIALASIAFMAVMIVRTPAYISHADLTAEIATFDDSTGCDCWWPVWARSGAFAQKRDIMAAGRSENVVAWAPRTRAFATAAGPASTASVKTWYYPRWQASVNGQAVPTRPDENGVLTVDIPADASDVTLKFVEPGYVRAAAVVSALSWLAMLFSGVALLIKSRRRSSRTS